MPNNLLSEKHNTELGYADFWDWFRKNEQEFYQIIKNNRDIPTNFLNKMGDRLESIKPDSFYYLCGMYDENTAEVIFTAESNVMNIAFVEDLCATSPELPHWRFTCLKQGTSLGEAHIEMNGYTFDENNIFFYSDDDLDYPDNIDIMITHEQLQDATSDNDIKQGVFILLDHLLGELNYVESIDHIDFVEKNKGEKEWIPIDKLPDFIKWRKKEYLEKYESENYNSDDDTFVTLESQSDDQPMIATMNTTVINWDSIASHPWISAISMQYNGSDNNGLPNEIDYKKLDEIEDELLEILTEDKGHIYIGRETGNNMREIYFASKDFRLPSKLYYAYSQQNKDNYKFDYDIYRDKYWISFDWLRQAIMPE